MAPKGLDAVRSGRGNSSSRLAMLSGPMKMRLISALGNTCVS